MISEELTKALELIEKSSHVGLMFPEEQSFDCIASAECIFNALKERGKTVGLFTPLLNTHPLPQEYIADMVLSEPLPKEFIVSLDTSKSPLSQLRYEKNERSADIIFSPKTSPISREFVSFKEGKISCDCVISLGIAHKEYVEKILIREGVHLPENTIVNVDISRENENYGMVNLVDASRHSIAEIVFRLISAWLQAPQDATHLTLMLAAILNQTRGLHTFSLNADTLLAVSELVRLGGDYGSALMLARENTPLPLLQLLGRALVRSKKDETQNSVRLFLILEDFEKTGRSPDDIHYILSKAEEEFPSAKTIVLLWQNIKKQVSVAFSGEPHTIEIVRAQHEDTMRFSDSHLVCASPFPSFRDAEEYIRALLEGAL